VSLSACSAGEQARNVARIVLTVAVDLDRDLVAVRRA
jgi:hypothetical protein